MEKLKKQMEFLMEIDKVKGILRQSVIMGDVTRRENDAEHSWHMAMCGLILKEYVKLENVDMEKVLKLMLIHDIVEIYSDDTPAFAKVSKEDKHKKELEACKKIFGKLPEGQSEEFQKLWLEFEEMETNEAIYANVFDRFQGTIQNLSSDGHTWKKWNATLDMVLKRMQPVIDYAPDLYEYYLKDEVQKYVDRGIIKK